MNTIVNKFVIGFCLALGLLLLASMWYNIGHIACTSFALGIQLPSRYSMTEGCRIKFKHNWVTMSYLNDLADRLDKEKAEKLP